MGQASDQQMGRECGHVLESVDRSSLQANLLTAVSGLGSVTLGTWLYRDLTVQCCLVKLELSPWLLHWFAAGGVLYAWVLGPAGAQHNEFVMGMSVALGLIAVASAMVGRSPCAAPTLRARDL